jgi:hypothetical protein
MTEISQHFNWLAIIVSTVVAFLLGWLWYSPKILGKPWAAGTGIALDENSKPPALAMITQIIGTFLLACIVYFLCSINASMVLFLVVLCLVFLAASQALFSHKTLPAVCIDQGYVLAMVVVMLIIQGLF